MHLIGRREEEMQISPNHEFYPRKMIFKHGVKHFLLDTKDLVYCYSTNKVVFVVDADNQKYIYDKNLLHLESELDTRQFFKINRSQIINFDFIRSFVTHEKNKMKVELKTEAMVQSVIISQTRVNAFKQWLYQQL